MVFLFALEAIPLVSTPSGVAGRPSTAYRRGACHGAVGVVSQPSAPFKVEELYECVHAARHLMDCKGLASRISDYGPIEPHDAYVSRLTREHGRKSGFWSAVEAA